MPIRRTRPGTRARSSAGVLLLRNNAVDPETAQLAAVQADTPSRTPRRGPRVPPAGGEPLF